MRRPTSILAVVVLLGSIACGRDSSPFARAGLVTAESATQVTEEIPDRIETVTRRVLFGPDVGWFSAHPYPDGRKLSLTDWTIAEVAHRDLETGEFVRVTHRNPAPFQAGQTHFSIPSPAGRQVVYDWLDWTEPPGSHSLRVKDLDSGEDVLLWELVDSWIQPWAWFPDGGSVLASRWRVRAQRGIVSGERELVRVNVEDAFVEVLHQLADEVATAAVSRDGQFVAFSHPRNPGERSTIQILNLASGRLETLLSGGADVRLFGWSPESDHLLYWSDQGGTPGLWIVPVRDGRIVGSAVLVLPDAWNLEPVGFADAGRFFYGVQVGGETVYVATLSNDLSRAVSPPTAVVPVTGARLRQPDWSPDGRFLAYIERHGQGLWGDRTAALILRNVETGEARNVVLGDGLQPLATPRWMPNGFLMIVAGSRDSAAAGLVVAGGIYQVDPETGRTTPVVTEGLWSAAAADGAFDVSPDGRYLYYRKNVDAGQRDLRVFRRDLETGSESEVDDAFRGTMVWDLALSPDGTMLAVNQNHGIALMNVDGSGTRVLLSSPDAHITSVTWAPDGNSLLFTRGDHEPENRRAVVNAYRIAVAGGEPERVAIGLDVPFVGQGFGPFRFHRDGRRVVFVAGEVSSELWMMENFLPEEGG